MLSAVHIAVHGKYSTSVLFHADDPDRMLVVAAPHIMSLHVGKAEYKRQFVRLLIVRPQIPFLHKGDDRPFFIYRKIQIQLCHSKQDPRLIQHMFVAVKYLIHTAVIVQKIHLFAAVPHAEKFFHIKCLDFPGITFASHLITRQ